MNNSVTLPSVRDRLRKALEDVADQSGSDRIDFWVMLLEAFGIENAKDIGRSRNVGADKARAELKKIATSAAKLQLLIDDLPRDAVDALIQGWVANTKGKGTTEALAADFTFLIKLAPRLIVVAAERADKVLSENPTNADGRAHQQAAAATWLAALAYIEISGRWSGRSNSVDDGREHGRFVPYLRKVFNIFGIAADPTRQARNFAEKYPWTKGLPKLNKAKMDRSSQ